MSKKLIITEKPSVARDFARVLGVSGNKNGSIENDKYVISWCYGHLVEMSYPESYDAKYKTWRLEDLPFLPKDYKYNVIESAKDQYAVVNSLLHREDIDTVYWAGDSGKEGQTIEENIRNFGGVREGMTELRVWIDSQTDEEILRGIREAKPMSEYERLGKSGIMRTIEDYSLGINFSRALSVKYGRMINDAAATSSYTAIAIGRVMTCVLGMVVNREREIRDFVETPFYRILGSFTENNFKCEWKAVSGSKYFESPLLYKENGFKKKESAEKLIDELSGKEAVIDSIESSMSKKRAPLLFNLAELQSECSKIFKISPADTLNVVQELYEKKLTTYPRTDARVLTTAVAKEISKNIKGLLQYQEVSSFAKNILDNRLYAGIEKTAYTDDSKVTDHYAIIPTGQTQALGSLSELAKSVYKLIAKRFLSIFYPAAEYKVVKLSVLVDSEAFSSSAKVLVKKGYLEVSGLSLKDNDDNDNDENNAKEELIAFADTAKKGDTILVNGYEIKEGKTSPPKRYTSGNLILAMENAGNLIEDEELREQIKKSGIGTSATRGEILDKLVRIKYLNQNSKTQIISPEKLGEMIYEVVKLTTPSLLNPEMTANWEMGLEGIINGTVDDVLYRQKLEDYIRRETTKMISTDLTYDIAGNINRFTGKDSKGIATRRPLGLKCPLCGGELTTTSFGYGCSNYFEKENKCSFSVGKVAGLDLSEEDFRDLITNQKTKVLSGFQTKNKRTFSAALKLETNAQTGQLGLVFEFDDVEPEYYEDLTCPVCKGRLMKTGFGTVCENRSKEEHGCHFSIGEILGKKLSEEDLRDLVTKGETQVIKGFKSKSNSLFSAKLKLATNEAGRMGIAFDFEGIEPDYVKDVKCPDCGGRILKKGSGFGCENFDAQNPESCKFYIGKIASKNLSESNVVELLTEGKTKTIRGFKGKSGKKFDSCLVLTKNEAGKAAISFDFENVEAKVIKNVKCPVCGGDIVKTTFGYGCSNYDRENKEGSCKFNLGTISGVKLKEATVTELLTNGITQTIQGFKSKSGKKFDAKLALNKDEDGIVTGCKFVFDTEEELIENVKCPKCQSSIIKGHMGYRCASYNKDGGCDFFVGKIAGVLLTKEQLTMLLTEKKTETVAGFTSKKGSLFDAKLKLDENNKIVFDFENE